MLKKSVFLTLVEMITALCIGVSMGSVAWIVGISVEKWIVPTNCAPRIMDVRRAPILGSMNHAPSYGQNRPNHGIVGADFKARISGYLSDDA